MLASYRSGQTAATTLCCHESAGWSASSDPGQRRATRRCDGGHLGTATGSCPVRPAAASRHTCSEGRLVNWTAGIQRFKQHPGLGPRRPGPGSVPSQGEVQGHIRRGRAECPRVCPLLVGMNRKEEEWKERRGRSLKKGAKLSSGGRTEASEQPGGCQDPLRPPQSCPGSGWGLKNQLHTNQSEKL